MSVQLSTGNSIRIRVPYWRMLPDKSKWAINANLFQSIPIYSKAIRILQNRID